MGTNMKTNKLSIWKMIVAAIAFWALFFAGGIVVHLVNLFSPYRYEPGTFGFELFRIAANPIGCGIGIAVYLWITDESAHISLLIYCVIGAVIIGIITVFHLLSPSIDVKTVISNVLCFVVMVVGVALSAVEIREQMRK